MNVHLRFLEEKDVPGMLEWMQNATITCFFRFDPSNISIDSCKDYIKSANENNDNRHYAIVDDNDEYLGTISLKEIDREHKKAEYAVSTRKRVHGTGVAKKATELILKIAFEELELETVYLNVLVLNERANAFYKKVGFKFDYCENNAILIRNEWKALNWYKMTARQYMENKNV